jgi:transposase
MGRLPEAYVASPAERELRELVRHRAKLVALRSGLKAQIHAVLAKQGLLPRMTDLFGVGGRAWLTAAPLDAVYRSRVDSLLGLVDAYDREIGVFRRDVAKRLADDAGYRVIQQLGGVGPTFAAIFVAEIGDVHRFAGPQKLCCHRRRGPQTTHAGLVRAARRRNPRARQRSGVRADPAATGSRGRDES